MNSPQDGKKAWCLLRFLLTAWAVTLLMTVYASGEEKPTRAQEGSKMPYPNYDKCNDNPVMSDREVGIRVSFAGRALQITFPKEGPWPLFGAYRVGQDLISEFGTQIESYALLMVSHKESRGVYVGRILKDDPPSKSAVDTPDKGGQVVSTGGYFAVDLKAQCRIPGNPGKYWVVVLLGKLSSPVLEFEVK